MMPINMEYGEIHSSEIPTACKTKRGRVKWKALCYHFYKENEHAQNDLDNSVMHFKEINQSLNKEITELKLDIQKLKSALNIIHQGGRVTITHELENKESS